MSEVKPPKIEFPCSYPVKVMGVAEGDFHAEIIAVFRKHAPEVCEEHVSVRMSEKGNYMALTVTIEATGLEQLQRLFEDLKATDNVKMVL